MVVHFIIMNKTTHKQNTQALERAIELVGGQSELSRRIGCSQQAISSWLYRVGRVPAEWCGPIEEATSGQVTRRDLREDLF